MGFKGSVTYSPSVPHKSEWLTILARANSISISLRTTVPVPVVHALGVEVGSTLVWTLATVNGSVRAVVTGEA